MNDTDTNTFALITKWDTRTEGIVRADYSGGAYIELTFGSELERATEVINVWDYETGQPEGVFHRWESLSFEDRRLALEFEVQAWIRSNHEEGWNDWYQGYLMNAR